MKQYTYVIIGALLGSLGLTGCDKYLDVQPKGKTLLTTVTNYDQWLNDPSLATGYSPSTCTANLLSDNYDYPGIATPAMQLGELVYTWAPQFSSDLTASPLFWAEHYAKINQYNTVLLGIDEATGGTSIQKNSLKGEALLGRALEYFYLINEYGKSYDSSTAQKDLAVPFVISNQVVQDIPPRGTVADITNQIITDLNIAIPNLPDDNSANRYRASKAAAYSVLARVYFYARNYAEARKNAALALANSKAVMVDYNGTLPASNVLAVRPDVIYGRLVIGNAAASLDFMRTFAANDLRLKKLYSSSDGYKFTTRGATVFYPGAVTGVLIYENTGTSVQEMKLIVAEAAARNNELTVALQQLDEVRKTRITAASYVAFQSNDPEEVLKEVLLERRHELAYCGLRWFDMRRLDMENRMDTVKRYDAVGNVVATLPPHSNSYTLQIPAQVLTYHPDMPQNP
ncbi:SusD family protein [Filimonas lacunae]|uniref:SusD family protein n=1 Tax=Filimonas lacunae TaxID=477680 RepID=A0A173MHV4_9BACT|nr:RagB/SusD family nutrient uptake outer membrane protein [Filimonas lacunae]BAV07079.1 hypothetical protein FLA_3099 [Filimonas lacunae]SIS95288.1 SusD family protein [Filimonas lacunae]